MRNSGVVNAGLELGVGPVPAFALVINLVRAKAIELKALPELIVESWYLAPS